MKTTTALQKQELPSRLVLVDHWQPLVAAWSESFASDSTVEVRGGDFFAEGADALVSPANSFGMAFDHASKPARIPSFKLIHEIHQKLRSDLLLRPT